MQSIWSKSAYMGESPALEGDKKVEAAIIGGGMAGILISHFLNKHGVKSIVLEAARIGSGQTKNTTAKITSQHDLIYHKLIQNFGEEKARQYASYNQEAIKEYARLIKEKNIDCEFEYKNAYLYSPKKEDIPMLEREMNAAQKLGIKVHLEEKTSLPFPVAGALAFEEQAQFHPLKFLKALSQDLDIFERTRVKTVEENEIITNHGVVKAEHIIFASHFPFLNLPGLYFARMHQERSYVLALQHAAQLDGMYIGIDKEGLSFRNSGELLLLGGGGHRTGESSTGGKYAMLQEKAKQFYPQCEIVAKWSAQDCMTHDGVPYIGQYAHSAPNWHVATGFAKWGMTTSMVCAMLITNSILKKEDANAEVFSPQRFTPSASMKDFLADTAQSIKGLARGLFTLPEAYARDLPLGHGGVVEIDDEKMGVYKNEDGEIFVVSVRCPHLGCQLAWNPDEKSWDCPCHGSRFDYQGNVIDNPAQENICVHEEP